MQIIWRGKARQLLASIYNYGQEHFGEKAAKRLRSRFLADAARLATSPYLGRLEPLLADQHLPYRSLVVPPHYKLIYWVDEEHQTIYISALWDTRRDPGQMTHEL